MKSYFSHVDFVKINSSSFLSSPLLISPAANPPFPSLYFPFLPSSLMIFDAFTYQFTTLVIYPTLSSPFLSFPLLSSLSPILPPFTHLHYSNLPHPVLSLFHFQYLTLIVRISSICYPILSPLWLILPILSPLWLILPILSPLWLILPILFSSLLFSLSFRTQLNYTYVPSHDIFERQNRSLVL